MDELTLDDKKYVSSKHAAKLTGYARDYIGQLCREGRITSRLVGRSWYVLESEILDHRFGNGEEPSPIRVAQTTDMRHAWEAPTYVSDEHVPLPVIARTDEEQAEYADPVIEGSEALAGSDGDVLSENEVFNTTEKDGSEAQDDVIVEQESADTSPSLEAVFDIEPVAPPEPEQLNVSRVREEPQQVRTVDMVIAATESRRPMRRGYAVVRGIATLVLPVIAVVIAMIATVNTGLFDQYLGSANQASVLTGYRQLIK